MESQSIDTSLKKVRKKINRLNDKIVDLLHERSKFSSNLHLYHDRKGYPDSRLEKEGIDNVDCSILLYPVYKKMYENKKNESNLDELIKIDLKMKDILLERILCGEEVGKIKFMKTASEQIQYKKREDEVKRKAVERNIKNNYGLNNKGLNKTFDYVMQKTKDVQMCTMNNLRNQNTSNNTLEFATSIDITDKINGGIKSAIEQQARNIYGDIEFKAIKETRNSAAIYYLQPIF